MTLDISMLISKTYKLNPKPTKYFTKSFAFHNQYKALIMTDTKVLVLLILFVYIFLTNGCITENYEVHLINKLPYPKLKFHCASGDTELGYHEVVPNFDFHWKFCDSISRKTLFFCHLWWEKKEIAFDIFTSKHSDRCTEGKCFWEARKDGIYFSDDIELVPFNKIFAFHIQYKALIMSGTKGLVLLVLFTYIFLTKGCFTDEYEVHLINRLPYPRLKFHCASGDNELGYHKVVPNFDFHWKFCESIWKNTLYFCHLWWQDKEIAFDIFTSKHNCRLHECFWEARKDGIYLSYDSESFKKMFEWKTINN
ncbi:plant self-incompatibility protein S1 family [Striga asiatica]|uniref:Plant self-incompatibility protein S1 family n=1 Tax=Striga asiatica TaxID=4170 RepID=A0A5A7P805_STRAF|nr:plant self-incompatibility protein S1 family [Striga asiatica]